MAWATIIPLLTEGMKLWNTERQFRFSKKHLKLLKTLQEAENAIDGYTDAAIALAEEDLDIFIKEYQIELKEEIREKLNLGNRS